ncbi:hypothetical protein BDW02DRAFT_405044 [Decorospora gaudefroyi]|uniref:Uncharacterized protein n=1 Tax=Decorospora gaudefroyi TaxID=184978 RepID=A0A6A5K8Y3_9PLEO|nr:hypothetical protein BDW02DRAFT_405044 [Decorospora gaudefroyi]
MTRFAIGHCSFYDSRRCECVGAGKRGTGVRRSRQRWIEVARGYLLSANNMRKVMTQEPALASFKGRTAAPEQRNNDAKRIIHHPDRQRKFFFRCNKRSSRGQAAKLARDELQPPENTIKGISWDCVAPIMVEAAGVGRQRKKIARDTDQGCMDVKFLLLALESMTGGAFTELPEAG